jgi:ABC-type multidrug transport system ATPase subunit
MHEDRMSPLLQLQGFAPVRKDAATFALCRTVDVELRAGDVLWLSGQNQVGKSSWLLALLGHCRFVGVRAGTSLHPSGRCVDANYAPQAQALQHAERSASVGSVRDVVGLQLARADAEECMRASSLIDQANASFTSLSPGNRQRLLAMMALFGQHPLTLLDEPCAGVDPAGSAAVWQRVQHVRQRGAVVVVSHEEPPLPSMTSCRLAPS